METVATEASGRRQQETAVRWYPMRIFHSSVKRQQTISELLAGESTVQDTYVPQRLLDGQDMTFAPALVNYVFIRTTLEHLRRLKADKGKYGHLRYVVNVERDERYAPVAQIAHVPEKQMQNFMRVINEANEQVVMLENMGFACKPGQSVRIVKGPFAGVEGTLKSIKKHLCVVIPIQNVMAVAITNVPRKYLQKISDKQKTS